MRDNAGAVEAFVQPVAPTEWEAYDLTLALMRLPEPRTARWDPAALRMATSLA